MFVLASDRSDFTQDWEAILGRRGEVAIAPSLGDLNAILLSTCAKLVLLDLELPGSRDPDILRSLQLACNKAKLMLGGISFEPSSELAGLAVGASACLDKSLPASECDKIIDVVLQGGIWLSSAGIPALLNKLQNFPATPQNAPVNVTTQPLMGVSSEAFSKLTPREREVAQMVSNGANNKTIARQLLITDRTVKAHLTSIFDKLNISDRLQLGLRVSARDPSQQ